MREIENKNHAIKFRIDIPTEELMARAQNYIGIDKSKFIRQSIREKATAVIAQHEKTIFSKDDWYRFFSMIDKPNAPTLRMKKAFQKHKDLTK